MIAPTNVDFLLFGTKVCSGCGTSLPACTDFFGPNKATRDGLTYYCRTCHNRRSSESYHRHPEKKRAYGRRRRAERP